MFMSSGNYGRRDSRGYDERDYGASRSDSRDRVAGLYDDFDDYNDRHSAPERRNDRGYNSRPYDDKLQDMNSSAYEAYSDQPRKKKGSGARTVRLIFASLGVVALLVASIAATTVFNLIGSVNYIAPSEMSGDEEYSDTDVGYEVEDEISAADLSYSDLSDSDTSAADVPPPPSVGPRSEDGVVNILLLGSDSRYKSVKDWNAATDVMIILTFNQNTQKIVMSSVMRDSWVYIPGRNKYDKLNSACAYHGGPARTVKTIENTFGVKLDGYAIVSFYTFIKIVDKLGGVNVEINKGELDNINYSIANVNTSWGIEMTKGFLTKTGKNVHLNGKQTMGYCRCRHSGNGDYERTERQREVLQQLIEKLKGKDISTVYSLFEYVASQVSTDLTQDFITSMLFKAATYLSYDIEQFRVPIDGTCEGHYVNKTTWALEFEVEPNREALAKAIFGE